MLRWGILLDDGSGAAAAVSLAPAMRAAGADLAVAASTTLSRAQVFASEQGVRRARGTYDDVIAADDTDAIFVAVAPAEREKWVNAALQAGKHVLCAVPLGLDGVSAGRMAAAAAAAGRVLMEAVSVRFHPRTDALLDLVRGGELGDVRLCTATIGTHTADPASFIARPAISLARWLVGDEPVAVRGRALTESFGATLAFADGAVAAIGATRSGASAQILEVVATDGVVRVPSPFSATRAHDAVLERDGVVVGSWRADPQARMLAAFDEAAAGGLTLLPPDDAVATAAVVDAVRNDP